MRRYLAFAGDTYYPSGGWGDYMGDADTFDDAKAVVDERRQRVPYGTDWAHVVDSVAGEEVAWWSHSGWLDKPLAVGT